MSIPHAFSGGFRAGAFSAGIRCSAMLSPWFLTRCFDAFVHGAPAGDREHTQKQSGSPLRAMPVGG